VIIDEKDIDTVKDITRAGVNLYDARMMFELGGITKPQLKLIIDKLNG
jgi:hypothetical protein